MRKTNQTPLQKKKLNPLQKSSKNKHAKNNFCRKTTLANNKTKPIAKTKMQKKKKIHLLEKNIPFTETNFFLQTKKTF